MILLDSLFPKVDVLLRRGGHIGRSDLVLFEFCAQNHGDLQAFYRGYESLLVQHPDGFFFLLPKGDLLRTRKLPKSAVHLGIFIALKARDPEITRTLGKLPIAELINAIETAVPREVLQKIYAPKHSEAAADARIMDELQRAMRLLSELGFIEIERDAIRPLEPIARFAELARHGNEPDGGTRVVLESARGVVFDAEERERSEEADDGE